jgi:hypothetical protein
MKHKSFHCLVLFSCLIIGQIIHGAWNPSDRESIVLNFTKTVDQFYEIGYCGLDVIGTKKEIPNIPEYQKPYVMYSSPPIANIKTLFNKDNALKIREPNVDETGKCLKEDLPYSVSFSILLPEKSNILSLISNEGGFTIETRVYLDQLKNYIATKPKPKPSNPGAWQSGVGKPYLLGEGDNVCKQLSSIPDNWANLLLAELPTVEKNAYVRLLREDDGFDRLIFVEISFDVVIGHPEIDKPQLQPQFQGFGYIDAIHIRQLEIGGLQFPTITINNLLGFVQPKIAREAFFGASKKALIDNSIPLQELIDNSIIFQTLL